MIIVPVKESEPIDKVLKKFKKKVEKTGMLRELRDRQKFTKPSVLRREEIKKAAYKQTLNQVDQLTLAPIFSEYLWLITQPEVFFLGCSVNFTRKLTFKGICSRTKYELIRIFEKKRIMIIERTKNEIVFRFPKSMKLDDLQDLTASF